jgi:hypothetical protein
MLLGVLALTLGVAQAQENAPVTNEVRPATEAAQAKPATMASADEDKPFRIPPGYKTKTRGDKTVYCRTAAETGSRFKTEKCFSTDQLKLELERIENEKEEFERGRRQCVTALVCANN